MIRLEIHIPGAKEIQRGVQRNIAECENIKLIFLVTMSELTRKLAYILWQIRSVKGVETTPEQNWYDAEKFLEQLKSKGYDFLTQPDWAIDCGISYQAEIMAMEDRLCTRALEKAENNDSNLLC